MPYDSQGNFTRVMNWQEDSANAVPIVASRHDDEDDNFAQGFNDCYCRDGRAPATGNFKMGSYKITGLGNGTTDNDAVNKGQLDSAKSDLQDAINTLDNAAVKLTGDQTIADVKTFTSSPVLPTPMAGDNSTKGATTAFVQTAISKETFPDYANASTASNNYTVLADGWVSVKVSLGNNHSVTLKINDVEVYYQNIGGDRSAGGTFTSPLYKVRTGDEVTTSGTNTRTITFYPLRG